MFDNIGSSERKLRIIVGLVLMGVAFVATLPEQWHMAAMTIAVPALFTAALGFCPIKALLLRKTS